MITWPVWTRQGVNFQHNSEGHPCGHICSLIWRHVETIIRMLHSLQKGTRESLKISDEVFLVCFLGIWMCLMQGLLYFAVMNICAQDFKVKTNQGKGTVISRLASHLLHLPGEWLITLPHINEIQIYWVQF